jgi:hypothetical protein
MTTDKCGISALLLQREFGLQRYETAWMMLHKLRRAMIDMNVSRCAAKWKWTRPGTCRFCFRKKNRLTPEFLFNWFGNLDLASCGHPTASAIGDY